MDCTTSMSVNAVRGGGGRERVGECKQGLNRYGWPRHGHGGAWTVTQQRCSTPAPPLDALATCNGRGFDGLRGVAGPCAQTKWTLA